MVRPLLAVRAIGGMLFILALIGMVLADFLYPQLSLDRDIMIMMSGMISVMLGIEILFTRLGIVAEVSEIIQLAIRKRHKRKRDNDK